MRLGTFVAVFAGLVLAVFLVLQRVGNPAATEPELLLQGLPTYLAVIAVVLGALSLSRRQ